MTAVRQVSQPGNTAISWRGIDPWAKTPTGELRFSHRLDGGPWSKFTRDTNHVFLALPAGNHVFEVRARDGDLNIQNAPTRVEFEVIAPVWRQPWFIGLLGVLITTVITQSYRVIRRDQRLRSSNRELSAEIEERKKAESALREKTELLQEKTTELEDEIEERRAIQEELEIQKHSLEKEIDERKRAEQEVERIHKELMQASHQAGMAEVATSVLHNIGNVLNSVNVSATVAEDTLRQLKPQNLIQSAELLEAHAEEANFLSANEKGRMLPAYLRKLCERWSDMQKSATEELRIVRQNIEHIREVVATQQAYARFSGVNEKVKIRDLVENAIRMNADALDRQHVTVVREYEADAEIEIEKNKVLQILVNLIRNAKHACIETGRNDGRVVMRIREGAPGTIRVEVTDNGVGILPENMTRIFSHGFTTRKEGHGFGLHSAANAAKTIGAKLTAHSDGPGRGATFALEFTLAATPAVL
jgi:C4-dicarboxylate-specific signal transduction histidine kinase